jgi:hypothetical protein
MLLHTEGATTSRDGKVFDTDIIGIMIFKRSLEELNVEM